MEVSHRSDQVRHYRTQSELGRIAPQPSHQGQQSDVVRTVTSYFDPVWNTFSQHTDGSMQLIPKKIVTIGEDFHSQVGNGKFRTTLYKVRWEGHDKKLREVWTKDFKSFRMKKMTLKKMAKEKYLVWIRIRLRKGCVYQ